MRTLLSIPAWNDAPGTSRAPKPRSPGSEPLSSPVIWDGGLPGDGGGQGAAAVHAGLGEDRFEVVADSMRRDERRGADVRAGQPGDGQRGYVAFPGGQSPGGRSGATASLVAAAYRA